MQDHMVFLIFKGISIFFSIMAVTIYIFNNSVGRFLLLHTLSSICYLQTFDNVRIAIYLVSQKVKNLPEMQESKVQSLGWEDPLEMEM